MVTGPSKEEQRFRVDAAESIAYRAQHYPNEILLPLGASAEPDTCGSCKFFDREIDRPYNTMDGRCKIKMPPPQRWLKDMTYEETGEIEGGPNRMKDTDRCDLHRPDGRVYVVQRRIPQEKNG